MMPPASVTTTWANLHFSWAMRFTWRARSGQLQWQMARVRPPSRGAARGGGRIGSFTAASGSGPTEECTIHKVVLYCTEGHCIAGDTCPAETVEERAYLDYVREDYGPSIKAEDDAYLISNLEKAREPSEENPAGGCPVHAKAGREEAIKAKATHPDALFLVHPECRAEVVELADFVGSTSGIMDFAEKSEAKEFIIGTENAIVQHLQFKCRNKKFYPLSKDFVCRDMKITTLPDVLNCVLGRGGEEIVLEEGLRKKAVKCIERMIELGG